MTAPIDPLIKVSGSVPAASFDKKGNKIEASKDGRVLCLKVGDDPRFHFALQTLTQCDPFSFAHSIFARYIDRRYVQITTADGEAFLLNVEEVAKRLHVKEQVVRSAVEKGRLGELIKERGKKVGATLNRYQQIGVRPDLPAGVTPSILMKVICKVGEELDSTKQKDVVLEIKGHTFFAKVSQRTGEIKLAVLGGLIEKGSYGEVYKVTGLTNDKEYVFKQALAKLGQEGRNDIKKEFDILTSAQAGGRVWGLQSKPKRMAILTDTVAGQVITKRYGFLTKQYERNYKTELEANQGAPIEAHLADFHGLLSGANYLAERKVLHGNIKPTNILVKTDKEGVRRIDLADHSSAVDTTKETDLVRIAYLRAYTPQYSSEEDIKSSEQFALKDQREELIALGLKRDVFSLGATLYEALTGESPYALKANGHPDLATPYKEIKREDVPQELKDLIKKMVHPNAKERPSQAEALAEYNTFLQKEYPSLHEDVERKMQSIATKNETKRHYKQIATKLDEVGGEFVVKGTKDKTGLSKQSLKQYIALARSVHSSSSPVVHLPTGNHVFNIWYDKKTDTIEMNYLSKMLGSGSFCKAFALVSITHGTTEVFKYIHKMPDEKTKQRGKADLQNEVTLLRDIHSKGAVVGVQSAPLDEHIVLARKTKHGVREKEGVEVEKYGGDLFDYIVKLPASALKERLSCFYQLAAGFKHLHSPKVNILHGDFKAENAMFKVRPDGVVQYDIIDFGGARKITPETPAAEIAGSERAFTPTYAPLEDLLLARDLNEKIKKSEEEVKLSEPLGLNISSYKAQIATNRQTLEELEKKRDVFALGTFYYAMITKKMPYAQDANGFPLLNTYTGWSHPNFPNSTKNAIDQIPIEVKTLIDRMLDPDYTQRPSMDEVFRVINTSIKDKQPTLFASLQENIKAHYPGSAPLLTA